jgi:hypothetical protein
VAAHTLRIRLISPNNPLQRPASPAAERGVMRISGNLGLIVGRQALHDSLRRSRRPTGHTSSKPSRR